MAQGGHDVALAKTGSRDEDDVAVVSDEVQAKQVLDLSAIDFGRPVPVELIHGFLHREARQLDAPLHAAILSPGRLASDQFAQVVDVRPALVGRGLRERLVVLAHERQAHGGQALGERVGTVTADGLLTMGFHRRRARRWTGPAGEARARAGPAAG